MASNGGAAPEQHDFLSVEHETVGFLINRDQFFASVYLESVDPLPPGQPVPAFCSGTMLFRQETLLVYELDRELEGLFKAGEREGLKIALIADIRGFRETARRRLEGLIEEAAPAASRSTVAFRIGSQAEIRKVPLSHIRLVPRILRPYLRGYGLYGCRFEGDLDIYFYIDIEEIISGGSGAV